MPTSPGDDIGIIDSSLRKPDTFFFLLCADLVPQEDFSFSLMFHYEREMCHFLPLTV